MAIACLCGFMLIAGLLALFFFANRSFASLTGYLDLDQKTQIALDKMSREIRQVHRLTSFSSTNLTFEDYDSSTLNYSYDPVARTLSRTRNGSTETLLTGCDSLQFSEFQRTPNLNTFQPIPTTNTLEAKVIQLSWNCSRAILGTKANTESMQSAKVVIRNK